MKSFTIASIYTGRGELSKQLHPLKQNATKSISNSRTKISCLIKFLAHHCSIFNARGPEHLQQTRASAAPTPAAQSLLRAQAGASNIMRAITFFSACPKNFSVRTILQPLLELLGTKINT